MSFNRLANCKNHFQGKYKRVLCVCSAGLLRSPTAAVVLSQEPFNFNTRSAGCVREYALTHSDEVLLEWADEIVCMEVAHEKVLRKFTEKPILCLNIPDKYPYRDPELMAMISRNYIEIQKLEKT